MRYWGALVEKELMDASDKMTHVGPGDVYNSNVAGCHHDVHVVPENLAKRFT